MGILICVAFSDTGGLYFTALSFGECPKLPRGRSWFSL